MFETLPSTINATQATQSLRTAISAVFERFGLGQTLDVWALPFCLRLSLRPRPDHLLQLNKLAAPPLDQSPADLFFTRLTLNMLLLHYASRHLTDPVDFENQFVCSDEFQAVIRARCRWAKAKEKKVEEDVRAAIKMLNAVMKVSMNVSWGLNAVDCLWQWGWCIVLFRPFKFAIYRTSNYAANFQDPLNMLWAHIQTEPELREKLAVKKKAGARILLQYAHRVGGAQVRDTFKQIIIGVEAHARACEDGMIQSVARIKLSAPLIDE